MRAQCKHKLPFVVSATIALFVAEGRNRHATLPVTYKNQSKKIVAINKIAQEKS